MSYLVINNDRGDSITVSSQKLVAFYYSGENFILEFYDIHDTLRNAISDHLSHIAGCSCSETTLRSGPTSDVIFTLSPYGCRKFHGYIQTF